MEKLQVLRSEKRKVLLLGVTFALLDLADSGRGFLRKWRI